MIADFKTVALTLRDWLRLIRMRSRGWSVGFLHFLAVAQITLSSVNLLNDFFFLNSLNFHRCTTQNSNLVFLITHWNLIKILFVYCHYIIFPSVLTVTYLLKFVIYNVARKIDPKNMAQSSVIATDSWHEQMWSISRSWWAIWFVMSRLSFSLHETPSLVILT